MIRRRFVTRVLGCGALLWLPTRAIGGDMIRTPAQTEGPFYPVPAIDKQEFFDVDLTRKGPDSPIADGDVIGVRGTVVDLAGKPIEKTIVEVWQACSTGRYNHPQDRNDRPIDPNFQYWGRMETDDNGAFAFKTIQPGKYPGRTPHIHFKVMAPKRPSLVTQMYFEDHGDLNKKDGIYMDLKPDQRKAVTVGFHPTRVEENTDTSDQINSGTFQIVLGPREESRSTQPM